MKKLFCMILALAMLLSTAAMAESGFAGGSGTREDPWQIASAEQLQLVRENLSGHYTLVADVDLSGFENWEPIGAFQPLSDAPEDAEVPHPDYAFTGTFDGAGHTNFQPDGFFRVAHGRGAVRLRVRHGKRRSLYRQFHA